MEAMRATWTDERLDDLNGKVDQGFVRLDDTIGRLDAKVDRLDDKIDRLDARLTERIDKLIHALLVVGASLSAAFLAFMAAIVGLIITQL